VGLLVAVGIWGVPAYLRDHGVYLRQVIFQSGLNLTVRGKAKPFYMYLVAGFVSALPLSIFLPITISDWRRHRYSPLLAVAAAILLVLTCVPKKRDHYLLPMHPFLALAIAASIVCHIETSRLVRRAAWTLVPLFIVAFPLYFTWIQPLVIPKGDPEIRFAKEILKIVGPSARIYCVQMNGEALAWIGGRYDEIVRVKLDRPDTIDQLRRAPKRSYLLVDEQRLDRLLNVTGPLAMTRVYIHPAAPISEIAPRTVRKSWIPFRFGDVTEEAVPKTTKGP